MRLPLFVWTWAWGEPNWLLNNLITYYKFENDFLDAHWSNDWTNNWTTDVAWQILRGRNCDWANDYINSNFNPTITGWIFSVSLWFKAAQTGYRGEMVGQWGAWGSWNASWDIEIDINKVRIYWYDGSGSSTTTTAFTDTASWHHAVCVFNGSTAYHLYLDNVKTTITSTTVIQNSTAYNIMIGAESLNKNVNFDWDLDEMAFYNSVLTDDEVTALYNSGAGLPYSSFTA